jgi:hypothetical protein
VRPNVPDPESLEMLERLRREAKIRGAAWIESGRRREPLPTGLIRVDSALGGGLPRGRLVEAVGGPSSGRTAFLLAVLASATSRGEHAALVDPNEALDPEAAARAGVALERLLWIRPRTPREALRAADLVLDAGGFGVAAIDSVTDVRRAGRGLPSPWARLALRAERSGSVLLALGERRDAGTFAAVALGFERLRTRWIGSGEEPRLFDRIEEQIEILKVRSEAGGSGAAGAPAGIRSWSARRDVA